MSRPFSPPISPISTYVRPHENSQPRSPVSPIASYALPFRNYMPTRPVMPLPSGYPGFGPRYDLDRDISPETYAVLNQAYRTAAPPTMSYVPPYNTTAVKNASENNKNLKSDNDCEKCDVCKCAVM